MGDDTRKYVCSICSRTFVRNEHLIRHKRIHTHEKPFDCVYCPQRFARSDLHRRHVAKFHGDAQEERAQHEADANSDRHERTRIACDNCNKAKVKCNSGIPCGYCQAKALECKISENRLAGRERSSKRTKSSDEITSSLPISHNVILQGFPVGAEQNSEIDILSQDNIEEHHNAPPPNLRWLDFSDVFNPSQEFDFQQDFNEPYVNIFADENFAALEQVGMGLGEFPTDFNFEDDSLIYQVPADPPDSNDQASSIAFLRFRHFSDLDNSRAQSPTSLSARPHFTSKPLEEDSSSLGVDNRAVLDEFIELFEIHVASWLECIDDEIIITSSTPQEWYLAVAAVGGLFCNTQGATVIARWLYNHARYKLLAWLHTSPFRLMSVSHKIRVVEVFIILSVFGYLASDKRIFELTEVKHASTVEMTYILMHDLDEATASKGAKILNDVILLDCYRIVFAQRPGSMSAFYEPADGGQIALLRSFMNPGRHFAAIRSDTESLSTLCRLGNLTWNAVHFPSALSSLWPPEFFESALHQWVCAHQTPPKLTTMLLFHMMHINMLVRVPAMQRFVVLHSNCNIHERPLPSTIDRAPAALFASEHSREKVIWHAQQLIDVAFALQKSASASPNSRPPTASVCWRPLHYSHSVCNAVLTLWCHSVLDSGQESKVANDWLRTGLSLFLRTKNDPRIMAAHRNLFKNLITDD